MKPFVPFLTLLLAAAGALHADNAEHTDNDPALLKAKEESVPSAPEKYRRPENYQPSKYQYSLEELKERFSRAVLQTSRGVLPLALLLYAKKLP